MLLTSEYWEKLTYESPPNEDFIVKAKKNYLLRYSKSSDKAISNHIDYIRTNNFETLVSEITEFFVQLKKSFTITLYNYINKESEEQILLDNGFKKSGVYQTMVAPLSQLTKQPPANDYLIKQVEYEILLDDDHCNILLQCFPKFFNTLEDVKNMLIRSKKATEKNDKTEIINFAAYDGTKPVGSAALYFNQDWKTTASLSGASVISEYRGRGIYTQLLYERALFAKQQGVTHFRIQADTTTSAPIVTKKGFVKVNEFTDFQYNID